jgi:hypothetical protein
LDNIGIQVNVTTTGTQNAYWANLTAGSNGRFMTFTNSTDKFIVDSVGNVTATGDINGNRICIAGSCQSSWPSGTNYWSVNGSNIYNNTGTNVGIGTASPNAGKLEVQGGGATAIYGNGYFGVYGNGSNTGVYGNGSFSGTGVSGVGSIGVAGGGSSRDFSAAGAGSYGFYESGGAPNYFAGSVSIGSTLSANGTASTFAIMGTGTGSGSIGVGGSGDYGTYGSGNLEGAYGYSYSGKGVHGYSSTGWAGYFDGNGYFSGNVGIGMSPTYALDVAGGIRASGQINVPGGIITKGGGSFAGTDLGLYSEVSTGWLRFVTNSGHMMFYSDGGTTNGGGNPIMELSSSGNLSLFYGTLSQGSDIRLKENIAPLTNSLSKVLSLNGVSFNWKPEVSKDRSKQVGFIAQDVEKVVPELVKTDDKGMKSLEYGNMSALLVEAVKEQQKQIDDLKAEVEALKAK